jgi:hypothetical protein
MYDDYALPKKASAKIMRFCEWLEALSKEDWKALPTELKQRLLIAVQELSHI